MCRCTARTAICIYVKTVTEDMPSSFIGREGNTGVFLSLTRSFFFRVPLHFCLVLLLLQPVPPHPDSVTPLTRCYFPWGFFTKLLFKNAPSSAHCRGHIPLISLFVGPPSSSSFRSAWLHLVIMSSAVFFKLFLRWEAVLLCSSLAWRMTPHLISCLRLHKSSVFPCPSTVPQLV